MRTKNDSNVVILASASPRRKDILTDMGVEFDVEPSYIDESKIKALLPSNLVKRLAKAKAIDVARTKSGMSVIISADTVVAKGFKVYGKPRNEKDAVRMISSLNNKWHTVYTGVCVLCDGRAKVFCVASKVRFKKLTTSQIEEYVNTYKPLDKAGAYGIQDDKIVEKYKGSYTNIVGLPKEKLAEVLRQVGVI